MNRSWPVLLTSSIASILHDAQVVLFNLDAVKGVHPMADRDLFSYKKPLAEGGLGMSKAEQKYFKMACKIHEIAPKKAGASFGDDPLPSARVSKQAEQQTFNLLVQAGSYGEDFGLVRSLAQRNVTGLQVYSVMACYNDDDPGKAKALLTQAADQEQQIGCNANSLLTFQTTTQPVGDEQLKAWADDAFEREVREKWGHRIHEWAESEEFRKDWHKVWRGYADRKAHPEKYEESSGDDDESDSDSDYNGD
eukprot:COSAG02_NODE_118_length_35376_cov_20.294923_21_plen_250_part_00